MHPRGELQRLHIDPYYCPALSDGYDDEDDEDDVNSPRSSFSSSFFPFSPSTYMSSNSSHSPLSTAPEWRLCFVLCLYDYSSVDPDHLSFKKNEILEIIEKEKSGWWAAFHNDRIGWIPSAFVAELSNEEAESLKLVNEELRVCEYEAERLFNLEPISEDQRLSEPMIPAVSTPGQGLTLGEDDNWIVPAHSDNTKVRFIHRLQPNILIKFISRMFS